MVKSQTKLKKDAETLKKEELKKLVEQIVNDVMLKSIKSKIGTEIIHRQQTQEELEKHLSEIRKDNALLLNKINLLKSDLITSTKDMDKLRKKQSELTVS